MKTQKSFSALTVISLVVALAFMVGRAEAAILVGPGSSGTGTNTFDATPAATDWSTASIAGGAGDITTTVALDADVNASIEAANIATVLGTSGTQPLSANALARRNTGGNYLQTCPTGVKYNVLMATLQNNSGGDLVGAAISYDLGLSNAVGTTLVEEIPGHRVYFSRSGAPGTWVLSSGLSGGTPGAVSASVF